MAVGEFFANEPLERPPQTTKLVVAGDAPAETIFFSIAASGAGGWIPGKDPVGLDPLSVRGPRFA